MGVAPRGAPGVQAMSLSIDMLKSLGGFDLNVTFDAPDGVTVLFGASGSGKTSIVNAIAGLLRPDWGKICLNGRILFDHATSTNVAVHKRRLGYVFQDSRLFPHLTVRGNLCYAARVTKRGARDPRAVADLLGLGDFLDRSPNSLSGGEAQRVAIGRALLARPDLLIMDEPLASLDAPRKAEILPYLENVRHETGVPILYVTHNMAEVARLATHIVLIEQGRVICSGPPDSVLSDPNMVRLIGLRDAGAVLSAVVKEHHADGVTTLAISAGQLFLPKMDVPVGTQIRVRVLAQDVLLARTRPEGLSALNILPVRVLAVRRGDGPGVIVQLCAGEDRFLARITRRSADALGIIEGLECFAVMKTVSVSQTDIGVGLQTGR